MARLCESGLIIHTCICDDLVDVPLPGWPVFRSLLKAAALIWHQSRYREEMQCRWALLALFQSISEEIGAAFLYRFRHSGACIQICLNDQWRMSEGQTVPPGLWDVKFKRCRQFGGLAQFNLSAQCPLLSCAFLLSPNDKEWRSTACIFTSRDASLRPPPQLIVLMPSQALLPWFPVHSRSFTAEPACWQGKLCYLENACSQVWLCRLHVRVNCVEESADKQQGWRGQRDSPADYNGACMSVWESVRVCVCVAADWMEVEGADAVLEGPWAEYKRPSCYDRSPVISERYSSHSATVWGVTGGGFGWLFTDGSFYRQMKDQAWPVT